MVKGPDRSAGAIRSGPLRYVRPNATILLGLARDRSVAGSDELGADNFLFRSQYEMIEQQLLPSVRPPCWVGGMTPYKLHHDRVQLEGLIPDLVVRRHSCNSEELGHPSDGVASIYGHHRIAVAEFNLVSIHLLHSDACVIWGGAVGGIGSYYGRK
jgi:hypothetical protein